MILTIYIIGLLITLFYYACDAGKRYYEQVKTKMQNRGVSESTIKTSVRLSIAVYVILWFIFMPLFIITNSLP